MNTDALTKELADLARQHGAKAVKESDALLRELALLAEQTIAQFGGSPNFGEMWLNTTVQVRQRMAAAYWDRAQQGADAFWESLHVALRIAILVK